MPCGRMDSLDTLAELARRAHPRGSVRLSKEDFVGAFKTLPLRLAGQRGGGGPAGRMRAIL